MIIKFKLFENDKNHILTLYHGSDFPVNFDKFKFLFLSEDIEFAKDYGDYLYEVKIKPTDIFDSLDSNVMKKLFDENDGKLYDPYHEKDVTFDDYDQEDTWEMIEYYGVNSFYEDCIKITEGGVLNYVISNPELIINTKKLENVKTPSWI